MALSLVDTLADLVDADWCWTETGHQLHIVNPHGVTWCGRVPFIPAHPPQAWRETKSCCRCVRAARTQ